MFNVDNQKDFFRKFRLCFRPYKLQSTRVPCELLHILLRRADSLHCPHVLGDAGLSLEDLLLSSLQVINRIVFPVFNNRICNVLAFFRTSYIIYSYIYCREGMKAKKRVTKLVLVVILVFTSSDSF